MREALFLGTVFLVVGGAMWFLMWTSHKNYLVKKAELERLKALGISARTSTEWDVFCLEAEAFGKTLWMKFDAEMWGELKGLFYARYRHFLPPNHQDYVPAQLP